ncbi:2'-5' RNA ligase family protein [Paenibacillus sp. y28]|uniref:2'-5' RNA ligase family protein n=1 Tax=Paenibacillus sp. y28 TaxID=3129110 RepID=UPI0030181D96
MFAAVPVPDEVKLSLYRWCSTSGLPFRRWTHRADYHITLQFYGSTRPDQADLLIRQLSAFSAGWSPFTLQLDGPSVFGNPQSPKEILLYESLLGQQPMYRPFARFPIT